MLLSDILGQGLGGGGKLRYQEFTSSGTFTPSAKLVSNGGECMAMAVGGGAGSAGKPSESSPMGGGHAGSLRVAPIRITGAVTVTIGSGSGGTYGTTVSPGGSTSIGSFSSPGGGPNYTQLGGSGASSVGSATSGGMGAFGFAGGGGPAMGAAFDGGGRGTGGGEYSGIGATANTGGGGGGVAASTNGAIIGGSGGSGFARVWWNE